MKCPLLVIGILFAGGPGAVADDARHGYVGTSSCSAYGCHGNAHAAETPGWKSSFVRWSTSDPHARAFRVLSSPQSKQIIALLVAGNTADDDGEAYWRVLERRCIGCHATPEPDSNSPSPDAPTGLRLASFTNGVSCESCHGAARSWLTEHVTVRWPTYSSEEKSGRWGMADTEHLATRAAVCTGCHIGPMQAAGSAYDVDHDLIAAGHPRLSFEFSAYLANLPPHWSESVDRQRNGGAEFDSRVWRVGQMASAAKLAEQLAVRAAPEAAGAAQAMDFANYECFDCHHRLQANRFERLDRLDRENAWQRGRPRPADTSLRFLRALAGPIKQPGLETDVAAALQRMRGDGSAAASDLPQFWRDWSERLSAAAPHWDRPLPADARVGVARRLVEDLLPPATPRWDDLVQLQLALAALSQDEDLGEPIRTAIASGAKDLAGYLNSLYSAAPPSLYASPNTFDPTASELEQRLRGLQQTLSARDQPAP